MKELDMERWHCCKACGSVRPNVATVDGCCIDLEVCRGLTIWRLQQDIAEKRVRR